MAKMTAEAAYVLGVITVALDNLVTVERVTPSIGPNGRFQPVLEVAVGGKEFVLTITEKGTS